MLPSLCLLVAPPLLALVLVLALVPVLATSHDVATLWMVKSPQILLIPSDDGASLSSKFLVETN